LFENRSVVRFAIEQFSAYDQFRSSVYHDLKFYCVPFFLPE
jgi:hypothetical protein